jgi:tetratricopeptide (TPR) repeat protein
MKIAGGALAVFPMMMMMMATMMAQEPPPPPQPPTAPPPAVAYPSTRPALAPATPRRPRARAFGYPTAPSALLDEPFFGDVPPMPAIAPMAPLGPMTPLGPTAPMPPMPPTPMALLDDDELVAPRMPRPALAPLSPMPPMPPMPSALLDDDMIAPRTPRPALAPLSPMPPMPSALLDDDMAAAPLFAMAFEPQDDDSRERARQAQRIQIAARAQTRRSSGEDTEYRRGASYLDRHEYDKAIDSFNRVIESKGDRADGALYWRAYAQNKLGKRDLAAASVSELEKTYPQSRWIEDAKYLSAEMQSSSGQPVSPDNASDEEIKILVLNSCMNTDPERCIPTLEKLLKSSSSPRIKERALFVLAQSRSPKARDLVAQIAKGTTNPDVQLRAIEYLGVNSSSENQQLLSDVYKSSNDTHIKRAILRSFMIAHNRDALLAAARNESNPDLRLEAIRQLGVMGGAFELYGTESTFEGKREILRGLMISSDAQKLGDLAKNEKDPKLRAEAVRQLGVMGRSKTGDTLVAMYRSETDPGVKREILNGLYIQQNDVALVDMARKETDPAIKRDLVSRLATMKSKVATDYMLEILSK